MLTNKQRKKAEEYEKLLILGQDSELKAKLWVQKEVKEQERKEQEYFNSSLSLLSSRPAKKKKVVYMRILSQIFLHHCSAEDIPAKYKISVDLTDIGIIVKIGGTKFVGAFKASFLPSYDFHAAKIMAVKLGNTIAHLEGYRRQSGGVLLPDQEDTRVYG